jgi:hypothetical protein
MIGFIVAIAALIAWSVAATFIVVARDGYRAAPVDWSLAAR